MRTGDIMQDPRYSRILFEVEGRIHDYDLRLQAQENTTLKDSIVKSALRKIMSQLKGASPPSPPKNDEERIKGALSSELLALFHHEHETYDLPRGEYIKVLYVIEESLVTRREMAGHSRGYLDFLKEFIPEARGNQ